MKTQPPATGSQPSILISIIDSERQRTLLTAGIFALLIARLLVVLHVPGAWPEALATPIRKLFWPLLILFGGMMCTSSECACASAACSPGASCPAGFSATSTC